MSADSFPNRSPSIWGKYQRLEQRSTTFINVQHIFQNGTVTEVRCRDEILHPIVRPYAGAIGPAFILMDDNARPHRAKVVDQYLETESIERME